MKRIVIIVAMALMGMSAFGQTAERRLAELRLQKDSLLAIKAIKCAYKDSICREYTENEKVIKEYQTALERTINEKLHWADSLTFAYADSICTNENKKAKAEWYNGLTQKQKSLSDIISFPSYYLDYGNSAGGHDFYFECYYFGGKDVKYVYVNIQGYKNAVDDYVNDEIGRSEGRGVVRLQMTGWFNSPCKISGEWNNVIYNPSARYAVISSVELLYKDGSKQTMNGKDIVALSNRPEPKTYLDYLGAARRTIVDRDIQYLDEYDAVIDSLRAKINILKKDKWLLDEAKKSLTKEISIVNNELNNTESYITLWKNNIPTPAQMRTAQKVSQRNNFYRGLDLSLGVVAFIGPQWGDRFEGAWPIGVSIDDTTGRLYFGGSAACWHGKAVGSLRIGYAIYSRNNNFYAASFVGYTWGQGKSFVECGLRFNVRPQNKVLGLSLIASNTELGIGMSFNL